MCCLRYERSLYTEAGREYPKLGTRIEIGEKKGRVVAVDIFRGRVTFSDDAGESTIMTLDEFKKARVTSVGTGEGEPAIQQYWDETEVTPEVEEEQDAG
jgi:cell fate regulator YaaT (PSP1 superfamily)